MYKRILLAIDTTPTEENISALKRAEQIGLLTGGTLYVLHVARSHIVSGDITGGAGLGVRSAEDDVEVADRNAVQSFVDQLSALGIEAHGEIVSATEHDIASVILQRARDLDADLLVLGHQHPVVGAHQEPLRLIERREDLQLVGERAVGERHHGQCQREQREAKERRSHSSSQAPC